MSMANPKISVASKQHVSRVEVYWHTVRYRTIMLYAIAILIIFLGSMYLVFPKHLPAES